MSASFYRGILNTSFKTALYNNRNILGISCKDYSNAFSEKTWIGTMLCGPSCVIATHLLQQNNINNIKIYMNKRGFGEIYEDHVFITINDIIIDPTFKQFLKKKDYSEDFYVGDREHLEKIIFHYGDDYQSMRHWEPSIDITNKVQNFISNNKI